MKRSHVVAHDLEAALILKDMSTFCFSSRLPSIKLVSLLDDNNSTRRDGSRDSSSSRGEDSSPISSIASSATCSKSSRPDDTTCTTPFPQNGSAPIKHGFQIPPRRVSILNNTTSSGDDEEDQQWSTPRTERGIIPAFNESMVGSSSSPLEDERKYSLMYPIRTISPVLQQSKTKIQQPLLEKMEISPRRCVVNDALGSSRDTNRSLRTHTLQHLSQSITRKRNNEHDSKNSTRTKTATSTSTSTTTKKQNQATKHTIAGRDQNRPFQCNPLPPPPLMFKFRNFQETSNMQTLSILAKKNRRSSGPCSSLNPPSSYGNSKVSSSSRSNRIALSLSLGRNSSSNEQIIPIPPQTQPIHTSNIGLKRKLNSLDKESLLAILAAKRAKLSTTTPTSSRISSSSRVLEMSYDPIQRLSYVNQHLQLQLKSLQQQEQHQQALISLNLRSSSLPANNALCLEVGSSNLINFQQHLTKLQPSSNPVAEKNQTTTTTARTKTSLNESTTTTSKKSNKSKSKIKICKMEGCLLAADKRTSYCIHHRGQRRCETDGCNKFAQSKTRYCINHGGGRRCTFPGCTKGARDKLYCGAHGGGRRCTHSNCKKLAVGRDNVCTAHGGGRRCKEEGCSNSALSSSGFCVRHGGGRKCKMDGCQKVARGKKDYCMAHSKL